MTQVEQLDLGGDVQLLLGLDAAAPVSIVAFGPRGRRSPILPRAIAEVFTAPEMRPRSSGNYDLSMVGGRLRHRSHSVTVENARSEVCVVQHDELSGLRVESWLRFPNDRMALRQHTVVGNEGDSPVRLVAVPSLTLAFAPLSGELFTGRAEWAAEGNWSSEALTRALPDAGFLQLGQRSRGRFAWTSTGSWSTGERLPTGVIVADSGWGMAWQVESNAGWHWELSRGADAMFLTASGATDAEHQASIVLEPGQSFSTEPATFVLAQGGLDATAGELTRARRAARAGDRHPPIVYNDFLNTLNANPTTETVLPLVDAASEVGVECYCLDAGWYSDQENWWDLVGDWEPSTRRFPGGLGEVFERIAARGLRAGIWLEPEVVGVRSRAAATLPDDAFFSRDGIRIVEHGRFHLDFRSAAARSHIDRVVDGLIARFAISYLKLDYNISISPGTTARGEAAGAGLLGHARAYRAWLRSLRTRYPELTIENCASGAMRADYALLSEAELQSTSDQVDGLRYARLAAAAPLSILPEQCANWATPVAGASPEEINFALTAGLMGSLYLSGHLDRLHRDGLRAVQEAVAVARDLREFTSRSVPIWPLGLPQVADAVVALALTDGDRTVAAIWSTSELPQEVCLPLPASAADALLSIPTTVSVTDAGVLVMVPAGPAARIIDITNSHR